MRTSRRTVPGDVPRSVVGSPRDLAVLESLAWAGFLTTAQVTALHFPSRRTAQRRLRALLDHRLVRARSQGEALQRPDVFTLSTLGSEFLADRGRLDPGACRRWRVPRVSKLQHSLAIRDVFVAFRAADGAGHIDLAGFHFEEELGGDAICRSTRVVPDAVATLAPAGAGCVAIEVDLGTETTTTLGLKLAAYAPLLAGLEAACPPASLLFVVSSAGRRSTVERLAGDAGLASRTEVVLFDALPEFLERGRSHGPYAPPVRAARTGRTAEDADFVPIAQPDPPAFRRS